MSYTMEMQRSSGLRFFFAASLGFSLCFCRVSVPAAAASTGGKALPSCHASKAHKKGGTPAKRHGGGQDRCCTPAVLSALSETKAPAARAHAPVPMAAAGNSLLLNAVEECSGIFCGAQWPPGAPPSFSTASRSPPFLA